MITIRATSFHGQPPSQPLVYEFDETGGTIGRATNNQLVLPDPERHISRVHASVVFRNGQYLLIDQGSTNPIQINGRVMGNGVQAPLADGDELRIGEYVLKVAQSTAAAQPAGPEAGLFGAPAAPPAPAAAAGRPVDDPLALFGGGAAPVDPLADLMKSVGEPAPVAAQPNVPPPDAFAAKPAPPASATSSGKIPEDFDPFAEQYGAKPLNAEPAPEARLPDDFDLGLGPQPAGGQTIDSMFGLKPGSAEPSDLFAPGSALGEQASRPNTAADADPFAALGLQQAPPQAPVRDQVPELHGSYVPPAARPAGNVPPAAAEAAPRSVAPEAHRPPQKPAGEDPLLAMFGGESADRPAGADALGLAMPAETPASPLPPQASAPVHPQPSGPLPANVLPSAPSTAGAASEDELLRAFLNGLGAVSGLQIDRLTPQMMQLIGSLLRESVQGTLDLLLARAMTKREVRAEVTMIVGRENNPLKFSPNAGAALPHLLGPPVRGFMTPEAAMKDAYDDLRAHTFGFMAGMRAALAGVLARFNPENLEKRLTEKSMLDSLLPMNRRAKLWDLFNDLYHDISQEAEEDFHNLFGREFLRAYEEQVARLHANDNNK